MFPRNPARRPRTRTRSWLAASLTGALVATLATVVQSTPAYAANPVTPGNFRGLGFDQCEAPSQSAMSTWIKKSPFRAAGIYISGNSRGCRRQSNLSATWVSNQLKAGWHLMPITLGPQANCSTRYPRYGRTIDPVINASSSGTYAAARAQGKLEASRAVAAARNLGIVRGSTLFYDLEGFNINHSGACTSSALWFLHAWTATLHTLGYASGYYSSAASGMRMLDDARVRSGNKVKMPDQIWIADWDGRANTSSSHIRSTGWQPYNRAKQYRGGHTETWGGVRINIDRNYLNLRTPKIPGASTPPTTSGPRYTGSSMSDPKCSPSTINRTFYRVTSAKINYYMVPLQCLLKQQRLYRYEVTGKWNTQTTNAVRAFQARVGHARSDTVSLNDWVSLIVAGNSGSFIHHGSKGPDVTRVQRALNAAGSPYLTVTGSYNTATANAIGAYQRKVGITATRMVGTRTWAALRAGRR